MLMLSALLRYRVSDTRQQQASILDLAIDLHGGDLPHVTSLHIRGPNRKILRISAQAIKEIDEARQRIVVDDVGEANPIAPEESETEILLKRDVRDALVLDVTKCVASRVNDLWLEREPDGLVLAQVDFSPWAVLHWILGGRFGGGAEADRVAWKDIEFLRGDPALARREGDVHRVGSLRPPEIARMVDALPYLHAAELLALTPDPIAADALEIMTLERQVQVFEELEQAKGARLLADMAPNAAADLLGWLDPELAARYLERVPEPGRDRIVALLRYPPGTAGGIMTNHVISVPANLTVAEAREQLRDPLREPDFVYYVYVVDPEGDDRLVGVLTLRDLLVADDKAKLVDIMLPDPTTIEPLATADEAARKVADSHLAAMPVAAGSDRKLLGVVTFDAALIQLVPASWRDQAPRLFS
jgi:magnesium transporter